MIPEDQPDVRTGKTGFEHFLDDAWSRAQVADSEGPRYEQITCYHDGCQEALCSWNCRRCHASNPRIWSLRLRRSNWYSRRSGA